MSYNSLLTFDLSTFTPKDRVVLTMTEFTFMEDILKRMTDNHHMEESKLLITELLRTYGIAREIASTLEDSKFKEGVVPLINDMIQYMSEALVLINQAIGSNMNVNPRQKTVENYHNLFNAQRTENFLKLKELISRSSDGPTHLLDTVANILMSLSAPLSVYKH